MKGAREYNEGKSVEERWAEKTQRKLGAKGVGRRNGRKSVEERWAEKRNRENWGRKEWGEETGERA